MLLYILIGLFIIATLCAGFNKYLPRWFCDHIGWHIEPVVKDFDGANQYGICPRCGKEVIQDSQGNWS